MFRSKKAWRRPAVIASLAAMVLATAIAAPAAAEIPEGATFVDGSDLDLTLTSGETFTVNLDVINGSEASAQFTLSILNLRSTTPGATPFTPAPDEDGVIATSGPIAGAAVWPQSVTIPPAVPVGAYAGQFVVTGSDGTLDQRGFRLAVSPSPGSFLGATSKGLAEPMPDITLSVERSSWIFNELNPAPDVFFPVDPLLAPRVLPGQLISGSGERADLSIGANGYVTITARGPGAYKGILARANEGAEPDPMMLADITLNVRDDWWAALALLLFALAAGLVLEWFATDWAPKASLRVRLAQLRDAAEKATTAHEAWMESFRHWPGPTGSPRITGESGMGQDASGVVSEIAPYLVDASARALRDFNGLAALEPRTRRWAADGDEYRKLVDAEQAFEALLRARQDLASTWRAFGSEMADAQALRDGKPALDELAQKSDTRRAVREALAADIIAFPGELERRRKLVDEATTTVGTLLDLAGSLRTIHYWMPGTSAHKGALDTLWTQLAAMPNPATDVEILRKAARWLLETVIVERKKLRALDDVSAPEDVRLGAIEIAARRPLPPPPVVAALSETPGDARRHRLWVNLGYGLLISAVALAAGLATQYFGKDTFGSISDYLGVITWGFGGVVAGGLLKNLGSISSALSRAR